MYVVNFFMLLCGADSSGKSRDVYIIFIFISTQFFSFSYSADLP